MRGAAIDMGTRCATQAYMAMRWQQVRENGEPQCLKKMQFDSGAVSSDNESRAKNEGPPLIRMPTTNQPPGSSYGKFTAFLVRSFCRELLAGHSCFGLRRHGRWRIA